MPNIYKLANHEVEAMVHALALCLSRDFGPQHLLVYPVPRGGVPVAYLLSKFRAAMEIIDEIPENPIDLGRQVVVVDDIIDSGATRKRFSKYPFYALIDKQVVRDSKWWVFPWENSIESSVDDVVLRTLQFIGEDPKREGLIETPKRVINSWGELYSGYQKDPKEVFKIFDVKYDELVLMKDIELYSTCEHHMLPFIGRAHIAYIADGKVIGASKLARLLEIFARRLQVQERLGSEVVDTLMEELKPKGAACIIEAKHLCMCSRGVGKQHSMMVTSAMRGVFLQNAAARAELMSLINAK